MLREADLIGATGDTEGCNLRLSISYPPICSNDGMFDALPVKAVACGRGALASRVLSFALPSMLLRVMMNGSNSFFNQLSSRISFVPLTTPPL